MNDTERSETSDVFAVRQVMGSVENSGHLVALGLVAIGMIAAFVGFAQFSRRSPRLIEPTAPDPGNITPPHGDKLLQRR